MARNRIEVTARVEFPATATEPAVTVEATVLMREGESTQSAMNRAYPLSTPRVIETLHTVARRVTRR